MFQCLNQPLKNVFQNLKYKTQMLLTIAYEKLLLTMFMGRNTLYPS